MTNTMALLEKLRSPLITFEQPDAVSLLRAQGLCDQAAREIERLDADAAGVQAELESVKRERHQLRNELTAARLDNERLRKALQDITCVATPEHLNADEAALATMRGIAGEALSGSPSEPNPAQAASEQLCNCGEFCAVGLYGNPGNGGRCRRDVAGLPTRAAEKSEAVTRLPVPGAKLTRLSDIADELIRQLRKQGMEKMQAVFDGMRLRIDPWPEPSDDKSTAEPGPCTCLGCPVHGIPKHMDRGPVCAKCNHPVVCHSEAICQHYGCDCTENGKRTNEQAS